MAWLKHPKTDHKVRTRRGTYEHKFLTDSGYVDVTPPRTHRQRAVTEYRNKLGLLSRTMSNLIQISRDFSESTSKSQRNNLEGTIQVLNYILQTTRLKWEQQNKKSEGG